LSVRGGYPMTALCSATEKSMLVAAAAAGRQIEFFHALITIVSFFTLHDLTTSLAARLKARCGS
jgi:hypothetical protein